MLIVLQYRSIVEAAHVQRCLNLNCELIASVTWGTAEVVDEAVDLFEQITALRPVGAATELVGATGHTAGLPNSAGRQPVLDLVH